MKTKLIYLFMLAFVLLTAACTPIRFDGPYEGRVLDAETGKPIQGVVVLGVWNTANAGPGGGSHEYYDAAETVSDKDGNFEIKGLGLKIMTTVEPMDVIIFKAGYEQIGYGPWESFKNPSFAEKVKWEGERAIISIKKLTMVERKKRLFGKESIPDGKQLLLIRELNKERIAMGLTPYSEVR